MIFFLKLQRINMFEIKDYPRLSQASLINLSWMFETYFYLIESDKENQQGSNSILNELDKIFFFLKIKIIKIQLYFIFWYDCHNN